LISLLGDKGESYTKTMIDHVLNLVKKHRINIIDDAMDIEGIL